MINILGKEIEIKEKTLAKMNFFDYKKREMKKKKDGSFNNFKK